jgi:hypothetical protein
VELVSTSLRSPANSNLPSQTEFTKVYPNSGGAAIRSDADDAQRTAVESLTLVRANAYFETADQSTLSHPFVISAQRLPSGIIRILTGSASTTGALLGMTLVAEPGTYPLTAFANVNGQQVPFGGPDSTITFGTPVSTLPGSGHPTPTGPDTILLVPPGQPDELQVGLDFSSLTSNPANPAVTTVVETSLGPAPPEGLSAMCTPPEDVGDELKCDPIYYDIQSTAAFSGPIKVCVTRRYAGVNGKAAFLGLWHYNESLTPAAWESLPAPDGEDAGFDCSLDSSQCGCSSDAACQIGQCVDPTADPATCTDTWNLFRVCGMTTSFSPFAPFLADALPSPVVFSNVVDGVTYTGAIGPPMRTWTVPGNARYRITAQGAAGGHGTMSTTMLGGLGAVVSGEFDLRKNDVLQIVVGQQGVSTPRSAGGGGGTFVVKNGVPLVVAGGGGGVRSDATVNGRNASLTPAGGNGSTTAGYTGSFVAGGTNGAGGARASSFGAGGGGWSGNGAADGSFGEGGFAFTAMTSGSKGGAGRSCSPFADGGHGGGGAGNGCFGAGGGGGYSGGGSGRVAGGGGSYSADPNAQFSLATDRTAGSVTIDLAH